MLFLRIFQHLLPDTTTWGLTINKTLRKFFVGLSQEPAAAVNFTDRVYEDLFPATSRSQQDAAPDNTGALEEFEKQFGLTPNNLSDRQARIDALSAEWAAIGGQSPSYIQTILRTAGFDVYVHDWWSSGPPYVARDPRSYTTHPLVGTYRCSSFPSQPRCSAFSSQPRCNRFLNNDPHYLVNKDLTRRAPPPVPDDPAKWPYFFYVGGPNFGDIADVDVTRRDEFERLLLKLRPLHMWIVTLINYAVITGSHITTRSGRPITTRSGLRLTT